jgi:hypothetical protein
VIHEIVQSPLELDRSQGLSGEILLQEILEFFLRHVSRGNLRDRPEAKGLAGRNGLMLIFASNDVNDMEEGEKVPSIPNSAPGVSRFGKFVHIAI